MPLKTPSNFVPLSEEHVDISGAAAGLDNIDNTATHALISFYGDDVRIRLTGVNPTSTVGALMTEGGYVLLETLEEMRNFKVILSADSSTATMFVIYGGIRPK